MNRDLLVNIENSILARKPKLAQGLQPGLTKPQIKEILDGANIDKNVDAVVLLYSWKNGSDPNQAQEPFFPETIYQFLPLASALEHRSIVEKAVDTLVSISSPVEMTDEPGRYLPIFWDGVTAYLAIDLEPGMKGRVMEVEFESGEPFRQVSASFEEFLAEGARAIRNDEAPSFLIMRSSS